MIRDLVFLVVLSVLVTGVKAQLFKGYEHLFTEPLQYNIYKLNGRIAVDGELNEASWTVADWSTLFTDIEGDKKPAPTYITRVKMLWDQDNLYIAAELEEPHIWGNLTQRDTVVFYDNDFEVFIDPDGDSQNYFEVEVNALKTVFDLFLSKPYRDGGSALINWDVSKLKLGVTIDGTLNKPLDKDKKWTVEMAIPFKAVSVGNHVQIPKDQTIWRMNFSRVEWHTEVIGGGYRKKTDPATGKNLAEQNWVWSPQGVINMHLPERWGYVQFLTSKAIVDAPAFPLPANEHLKKLLWLVYYKQRDYFKETKHFTTNYDSLHLPRTSIESNGRTYTVRLEATTNLFEATITDDTTNETWRINQSGELKKAK